MGILLTTTKKAPVTEDPFLSGKFSKTVIQAKADSSSPAPAEDIPFSTYLCLLMIDEKHAGLFQSISDIEAKRDVEPLTQGGMNEHTYEFPKGISYGHMTLKSGFSTSTLLLDWMMAGQYDARPVAKNIVVILGRPNPETNKVELKRKFTFFNSFPVKWKISDLSVDDTEKIVIESIEISYDYFIMSDE